MQLESVEAQDPAEQKEEQKVDLLSKYSAYNKELMECYKFVIQGRFNSMCEFFKRHSEEEKKKEEGESKVTKCGRCVKTVFIYGSVTVLFSLVAYGQYTAYVAVNGSPFEA